MKKLLFSILPLALTSSAIAAVGWDGSESSDFSDVNNWGFASPPVSLSGEALNHDTNGSNAPIFSSGVLNVTSYVFGPSAFGANVNTSLILNGGSLTTTGDFEIATGRDNHQATVDISNGSVLEVGGNLDNINNNAGVTSSTFTLNVLNGGVIQGVNQFRGDSDVNVSGGTFHVGSIVGAATTTTFAASGSWINNDSDFVLSGTGQVVFDVFGVGSVDQFSNNSGQGAFGLSLDLSGGTVVLALDPGYSPAISDSFDLIAFVASDYFTLSASNVADSLITGGVDAGKFVEWDTTLWETDGILSVGAIVIPEPSSFAVLTSLLAVSLVIARRKNR